MPVSLTDKELKIISILKSGSKMSAGDIKRVFESRGEQIPYTTISSALEKLYSEKILDRVEVRSRGKYGKKYLYYLSEDFTSVDNLGPVADMVKSLFSAIDGVHSSDSVAFVDRNGILTLLYGNGRIINDSGVIGKRVDSFHSGVTAKFVRQIFEELKSKKRDFFRRVVNFEGRNYEKYYCGVWSSDGEFLGVLVITKVEGNAEKLPREIMYP
ncbi:PAS domain-containing protein [Geoglobus acetivorans]|uniref:Uncharacterized protein n=1 Tax=Geoglobus acetivorans TaxID=565033 RepID=A0A0A7GBT4_GEOAI|nr:hypothetical protein GACE_0431 [Geoglobus acetivorans]